MKYLKLVKNPIEYTEGLSDIELNGIQPIISYKNKSVISSGSGPSNYLIWYTTNDKSKLILSEKIHNLSDDPNIKVINHEYNDIYGVIEFSVEINKILDVFNGMPNLESIILPKSITEIGPFAFLGCYNLMSVKSIGEIKNIKEAAFDGCTKLNHINLNTVEIISRLAFNNCYELTDVDLSSTTALEPGAFLNCTLLSNVLHSNKLTLVGQNCFLNCMQLKQIDTSGIEIYGPAAFANCTLLENIELNPKALLDTRVFQGCSSVKSIVFPDKMDKIPNMCCAFMTKLEYVHLPKALKYIGSNAFNNCFNLTTLDLDDDNNIAVIEAGAFNNCVCISKEVWKFPKLKTYGTLSFDDVLNMREIYFGPYLEPNENGQLANGLPITIEKISIDPNNQHFVAINNIVYTKDLSTVIDGAQYNFYANEEVLEIEDGATTIKTNIFKNIGFVPIVVNINEVDKQYNGLQKTLKELVADKTIKRDIFNTKIKVNTIILPSTIESIDAHVFENAFGITTIICRSQEPPTIHSSFFVNKGQVKVYVPNRKLTVYRNSDWGTVFGPDNIYTMNKY